MKRALIGLLVVAACGRGGDGKKEAAGERAAAATAGAPPSAPAPTKPVVAAGRTAPATSVAVPAGAEKSASLACVLELAASRAMRPEAIDDIVDEAPRGGLTAILDGARAYGAIGDLDATDVEVLVTTALADRGRGDEASALLRQPEVAKLDDALWIDLGFELGELRLRAGLPAKVTRPRALPGVRARALGGDVKGALAQLDALRPGEIEDDPVVRVTALLAVGKDDDAYALAAGVEPPRRFEAAATMAEVAVARGQGVERAIAALVAARRERGQAWTDDRLMLRRIAAPARGRGHAADVAPLRRAIIDDLAATPKLDYDAEALAAQLADEADAGGAADERVALEPVLARIERSHVRARVKATQALHQADLDGALAALRTMPVEPALWLRLWLRHAGAGLAPAFDGALADAACGLARARP